MLQETFQLLMGNGIDSLEKLNRSDLSVDEMHRMGIDFKISVRLNIERVESAQKSSGTSPSSVDDSVKILFKYRNAVVDSLVELLLIEVPCLVQVVSSFGKKLSSGSFVRRYDVLRNLQITREEHEQLYDFATDMMGIIEDVQAELQKKYFSDYDEADTQIRAFLTRLGNLMEQVVVEYYTIKSDIESVFVSLSSEAGLLMKAHSKSMLVCMESVKYRIDMVLAKVNRSRNKKELIAYANLVELELKLWLSTTLLEVTKFQCIVAVKREIQAQYQLAKDAVIRLREICKEVNHGEMKVRVSNLLSEVKYEIAKGLVGLKSTLQTPAQVAQNEKLNSLLYVWLRTVLKEDWVILPAYELLMSEGIHNVKRLYEMKMSVGFMEGLGLSQDTSVRIKKALLDYAQLSRPRDLESFTVISCCCSSCASRRGVVKGEKEDNF